MPQVYVAHLFTRAIRRLLGWTAWGQRHEAFLQRLDVHLRAAQEERRLDAMFANDVQLAVQERRGLRDEVDT